MNGKGSKNDSAVGVPAAVYDELRELARLYLGRQQPGHTLQPTALVHEACMRLLKRQALDGVNVPHFFAVAAKAMRSVLVDHARRRGRQKRGGGARRVPLDDVVDLYEESAIDLVALDNALIKLGQLDLDLARVVELRFFGGLTEQETATMLGVSPRTVGRLWRRARAWLKVEMTKEE